MAKKAPVAAGTNLYDHQAVDFFAAAMRLTPDVDEILRKAGLGRAGLRQLEYDDEVACAIETRLTALLGTPWRLEPGEGPAHDLCHDQLTLHFDDLVTGIFNARLYGYSVVELVWNEDRTLKEAAEKPFEWFVPTKEGELLNTQTNAYAGDPVDTTYKFLLTRYRKSWRNPRGEALLSRCYWPWFFRTHGWRFYAKFLERHGSPLLVGKGDNPTEMAKALQSALASAVAAVGKEDSVESVGSGNAGVAFESFQRAQDKRIQKVILGQTLTTDSDGKGSYALGKVHDDVRDDRRQGDIKMVSRTIQRFLAALCALNGIAEVPQFVMGDTKGLSVERAKRDKDLVDGGIVSLTEQYLLDRYDFVPGDFVIPAEKPAIVPPDPNAKPPAVKAARQFAGGGRKARFTAGQQAVEDLGDAALERARSPLTAVQLRAAIRASRSPAELEAKLGKLLGDAEPVQFRQLLERALFAADVMGYAHSAEQ